MPKTPQPEWIRLFRATTYSLAGLTAAWKNEAAFRHEAILSLLLIPLAFWLGETPAEKILLVLPIFLVLLTELLNSAIEAIVDRISTEHHKLSGRAKDIGSAAVFVALIFTVVVWGTLLLPRLF